MIQNYSFCFESPAGHFGVQRLLFETIYSRLSNPSHPENVMEGHKCFRDIMVRIDASNSSQPSQSIQLGSCALCERVGMHTVRKLTAP